MLAFVGVCVQKGLNFHWPGVDAGGFYYDASAPWYSAPTSAFATNAPGMAQILVVIGLIEGQFEVAPFWYGGGDRQPGDYGFYPFGKVTGAELVRKQKAELKNRHFPSPQLRQRWRSNRSCYYSATPATCKARRC